MANGTTLDRPMRELNWLQERCKSRGWRARGIEVEDKDPHGPKIRPACHLDWPLEVHDSLGPSKGRDMPCMRCTLAGSHDSRLNGRKILLFWNQIIGFAMMPAVWSTSDEMLCRLLELVRIMGSRMHASVTQRRGTLVSGMKSIRRPLGSHTNAAAAMKTRLEDLCTSICALSAKTSSWRWI